jgi:hypothetical protein
VIQATRVTRTELPTYHRMSAAATANTSRHAAAWRGRTEPARGGATDQTAGGRVCLLPVCRQNRAGRKLSLSPLTNYLRRRCGCIAGGASAPAGISNECSTLETQPTKYFTRGQSLPTCESPIVRWRFDPESNVPSSIRQRPVTACRKPPRGTGRVNPSDRSAQQHHQSARPRRVGSGEPRLENSPRRESFSACCESGRPARLASTITTGTVAWELDYVYTQV